MSVFKYYINRTFLISVTAVLALSITGCSKSDEEGENGGGTEENIRIALTENAVLAEDIAQFADITCRGEWNLSFVYPEGTATWCSTPTPSGNGDRRIALSYTKNTAAEKRLVTIRLISGADTASATLTQWGTSGKDPDSGGGEQPNSGWLELPAVGTETGCRFLTHYTKISSKRVRNFSMYFDTDERIAYWVAYPHCSMYLGSTGRTDAFQADPDIPYDQQMSSTINGYDRGHQIPSGDRTVSYDANMQTFYYSNMTPQLGSFNQKIWVDMEGKVRDWLKGCDTLYVVTGAILKTVGGNESVKYVKDKSGHSIAVPNYYFKTLLRLDITPSGRNYRAIGFWFRHVGNSGPVTSAYALSVDEIEQKTGIDFFVNLPKDIQDKVEAEKNPKDWGL